MIILILNVISLTYLFLLFLTFLADYFIKSSNICLYLSFFFISSFLYQLFSILIVTMSVYIFAVFIPIIMLLIIITGTKVIEIYSNRDKTNNFYIVSYIIIFSITFILILIGVIIFKDKYYNSQLNDVTTFILSLYMLFIIIYNISNFINNINKNKTSFYFFSSLSVIFSFICGATIEILDKFIFVSPKNMYFLTIISSLSIYGSYIYDNYKISRIKLQQSKHPGLNYSLININKFEMINNTILSNNEIIFINSLFIDKPYKEIAADLNVSEPTIKRIASKLFTLFNVKDKSELKIFLS